MEFDGQVVRLKGIEDVAKSFIRVRLPRIDNLDLNLFEFDWDLTMMIFFIDADERVYARYGGRDGEDADNRQSVAGLKATMQSVLAIHDSDAKEFAPRSPSVPKSVQSNMNFGGKGRCMHCHQVKEAFQRRQKKDGDWDRDQVWRYPLPDNLGIILDVDKSNVVEKVSEKSPAAAAGIRAGDVVKRIGAVPIHSFGDAQFALDKAPTTGALAIAWQRGDESMSGNLVLPSGWRKTDIAWRRSVRSMIPSLHLSGTDLTPAEKQALGFGPKQLAFRQSKILTKQAETAGIRAGDIILGLDAQTLVMDSFGLRDYVQRTYLVGDTVAVDVLRDGQRLSLPMKLGR